MGYASKSDVTMKNVTAPVKSFLRDLYLFRAVKSLKDLHPDIHVLVADDGHVSDTKEAKLRDMGVERYIRLRPGRNSN